MIPDIIAALARMPTLLENIHYLKVHETILQYVKCKDSQHTFFSENKKTLLEIGSKYPEVVEQIIDNQAYYAALGESYRFAAANVIGKMGEKY